MTIKLEKEVECNANGEFENWTIDRSGDRIFRIHCTRILERSRCEFDYVFFSNAGTIELLSALQEHVTGNIEVTSSGMTCIRLFVVSLQAIYFLFIIC